MVKEVYEELINNVLSLPNAPMVLNEIKQKLEEERKKREQFYNEITEYEKAEFINGEIIIHSPVKKEHNDVSGALYQLISAYVKKNKLGYVGYEKIMISLSRNDYEPDLCYFNEVKSQQFQQGQSLFPAPDLVVEVLSKGTASNDRGIKFEDYQAHNILEYWMIDPNRAIVEQYRLDNNGAYELILKAGYGQLECKAIKDFNIPIASIFDEDQNLDELTKILTAK